MTNSDEKMLPESVYVHIPFCKHRCGYCNFTLIAGRDDLEPEFLDCLEREFEGRLTKPLPVKTLFLGGGTPSHLSFAGLERLAALLTKWFLPHGELEFSCEINPLDCTTKKLQMLKAMGVNRVSVGGQSFDDDKLTCLERDHTAIELGAALAKCCETFQNVSLDLIFAAPGETLDVWQRDLSRAAEFPLSHISTYGLTIEAGSAFYGRQLRSELVEIDEEVQREMYELAIKSLHSQNFEHYEVSSFATPNARCQHNMTYWLGEPWYGFGPGAASYLRDDEHEGGMLRTVNHQSVTTYLKRMRRQSHALQDCDRVNSEEQIRERFVFGLRMLDGIDFAKFPTSQNEVRKLFEPQLSDAIQRGYLTEHGGRLKLTHEGLMLSDSLWPAFLQGRQDS